VNKCDGNYYSHIVPPPPISARISAFEKISPFCPLGGGQSLLSTLLCSCGLFGQSIILKVNIFIFFHFNARVTGKNTILGSTIRNTKKTFLISLVENTYFRGGFNLQSKNLHYIHSKCFYYTNLVLYNTSLSSGHFISWLWSRDIE
jgi:hypothetical protein